MSNQIDLNFGHQCERCGYVEHGVEVIWNGVSIRPSVIHFVAEMERVLRADDLKGGWLGMSDRDIADRMSSELAEVDDAIQNLFDACECDCECGRRDQVDDTINRVIGEAVGVANLAMMLIDPERLANPNSHRCEASMVAVEGRGWVCERCGFQATGG